MNQTPALQPWKRANTDWLMEARWGMFVHYLADAASNLKPITLTADEWNRRIDAFDVDGLADQLAHAHVPYFCITIGQNSGFYLSPNSTYDAIVGIKPSKCSKRDLVADLAKAFKPHGIRLMVYLPGVPPATDAVAKDKLELPLDDRLSSFQKHWEAIVREWSLRWGKAMHGWWIDGPYNAPAYQHPDAPNYRSFAEALKAGNPDSLVSFNNGLRLPLYSITEYEDFTPGEIERELPVAPGCVPDYSRLQNFSRFYLGPQLHVLTIMGEWWGKGPLRFPDELTIGYTKFFNSKGGVISWDAPLQINGLMDEAFRPQIEALGRAIKAEKEKPQK
ncbi:MAG: alpha-L-fucosidase [Opitutaceae bacterium]